MYERMLNKKVKPDMAEMAAYCGDAQALFLSLNNWLSDNYQSEQQISFPYGNQYGWGVAHRKKQKLLCHVFAEKGAFVVMMRLSDQQYASIYEELLPYTKEFIDQKYPCGNGGWIHYRVMNQEQLNDIQKLLSLKCAK